MATSKTLTPTNVTIQIPEFTDQPDQRVNSNCIDKEADAINALNGKLPNKSDIGIKSVTVPKNGSSDILFSQIGNNIANGHCYHVTAIGTNSAWKYYGILCVDGSRTNINQLLSAYVTMTASADRLTINNVHPDYDMTLTVEIIGRIN